MHGIEDEEEKEEEEEDHFRLVVLKLNAHASTHFAAQHCFGLHCTESVFVLIQLSSYHQCKGIFEERRMDYCICMLSGKMIFTFDIDIQEKVTNQKICEPYR